MGDMMTAHVVAVSTNYYYLYGRPIYRYYYSFSTICYLSLAWTLQLGKHLCGGVTSSSSAGGGGGRCLLLDGPSLHPLLLLTSQLTPP